MGIDRAPVVEQIRTLMKDDGVFDRGDLDKVRTVAKSDEVLSQSLNVVLDEMLRGAFQIPSCFRMTATAQEELKNLESHGLTPGLSERIARYMTQATCLHETFDPSFLPGRKLEVRQNKARYLLARGAYEAKIKAWEATNFDPTDKPAEQNVREFDGLYRAEESRLKSTLQKTERETAIARQAFDETSAHELEMLIEEIKAISQHVPSYEELLIEKKSRDARRWLAEVYKVKVDQSGEKGIKVNGVPHTFSPFLAPFANVTCSRETSAAIAYLNHPEDFVASFLGQENVQQRLFEQLGLRAEMNKNDELIDITTSGKKIRFHQGEGLQFSSDTICLGYWVVPMPEEKKVAVVYKVGRTALSIFMSDGPLEDPLFKELSRTLEMAHALAKSIDHYREAQMLPTEERPKFVAHLALLENELHEREKAVSTYGTVGNVTALIGGLTLMSGIIVAFAGAGQDPPFERPENPQLRNIGIGMVIGGGIAFFGSPILHALGPDTSEIKEQVDHMTGVSSWW